MNTMFIIQSVLFLLVTIGYFTYFQKEKTKKAVRNFMKFALVIQAIGLLIYSAGYVYGFITCEC